MNWNEKDIEDWAEQYLPRMMHPHCVCIGRQVTLPSGRRVDLLFWHRSPPMDLLTVVELKQGRAGIDAVTQLARYMDEIDVGWDRDRVRICGALVAESFDDGVAALVRSMPSVSCIALHPRLTCEVLASPRGYVACDCEVPIEGETVLQPDEQFRHWLAGSGAALEVNRSNDRALVAQVNQRVRSARGQYTHLVGVPRRHALVKVDEDCHG